MKYFNPETKTYKLLEALKSGKKFTASQAEKALGIKNLSAEASRLRAGGHAVYANTRKAGNGVTVTTYELGRPSREVVALGYAAKAAGFTVDTIKAI
jgi:predicted ArsR family transcriptional regulator